MASFFDLALLWVRIYIMSWMLAAGIVTFCYLVWDNYVAGWETNNGKSSCRRYGSIRKQVNLPGDVLSATQKSWRGLGSEAIAREDVRARRARKRMLLAILGIRIKSFEWYAIEAILGIYRVNYDACWMIFKWNVLKWSGSHLQKEEVSTWLGAIFVSSLLCSIIIFSCWLLRRGSVCVR